MASAQQASYHGHGQIFDLSQRDGLFWVMWPVSILQPWPANHDLCVSLDTVQ